MVLTILSRQVIFPRKAEVYKFVLRAAFGSLVDLSGRQTRWPIFRYFIGVADRCDHQVTHYLKVEMTLNNTHTSHNSEQDAYTSASRLWTNCECVGIVRCDIFQDTLPHKYPYFSLFV